MFSVRQSAIVLCLVGGLLGCASAPRPPVPASSSAAPSASASATSPDAKGVQGLMMVARQEVRRCYQQGLAREPEQEGKVVFFLQVGSTGAVSQVTLTPSGPLRQDVMDCIRGVMSALVFAPPHGGSATVTGSFTFLNRALHPEIPDTN